jgi:hypothetical protein
MRAHFWHQNEANPESSQFSQVYRYCVYFDLVLLKHGFEVWLIKMENENDANRKTGKQARRGKECVSASCNGTEYSRDGSLSNIHFFKFPCKPPLRNRWCNLIKRQHGRDDFLVNEKSVICDKHFKPEDIYRPPGGTRHRLRQGKL